MVVKKVRIAVKSFAAGSTGDVAPLTDLIIDNDDLGGNGRMALGAIDAAGNIYAPGDNGMSVYAPGSNGFATPTTVFTNNGDVDFSSPIALDSQGDIYAAAGAAKLDFFTPANIANSTPARALEGAATRLAGSTGLAVDASGNLYVVGYATPSNSYSLKVYRAGSIGNVAPKFVDAVPNTSITFPEIFLAVSPPATP